MEWTGTPSVVGRGSTQLALVTLSIAGLQFAWGIEQAYVSVYLLNLGLSKSLLSLIWVAGPLCGLVIQPVAGVVSDHWTGNSGRRRPFMMWGAILVAVGLTVFAWSSELADFWGGSAAWTAVVAILIVDVTLNACQACCRALIVDVLPLEKQIAANSWAGRMSTGGHLISYGMIALDLTTLGFSTQIKGACTLSAIAIVSLIGITCVSVNERVLVHAGNHTIWSHFCLIVRDLWETTTQLDKILSAVFKVQLFAWYSWFTFLFYGSTYIAELWAQGRDDVPFDDLARAGSRGLVVFSASATVFAALLPHIRVKLIDLWSLSFVVYAVAIFVAGYTSSYKTALLMYALVGICWAMTMWAPYALTSERIHELPADKGPNDEDEEIIEARLMVANQADPEIPRSHNERSGVYLGIHNCAITLPQFVSTFGSFVIFKMLDSGSSDSPSDGGHAIGVTLQVGAATALLATVYAQRIKYLRR